jgi:acyl-CoA thioesterase FadM
MAHMAADKKAPQISTVPRTHFVHRLKPRWAHSDPARMIYTPRFGDFCMEAIEAWYEDRVGADWYRINLDWGVGTPFVHMEIDFRSTVTPRDALAMTVAIERVGTSSLAFKVTARTEVDGRLCFEGRFVSVCVPSTDQGRDQERGAALRSIPLDPRLRAAALTDAALGPV